MKSQQAGGSSQEFLNTLRQMLNNEALRTTISWDATHSTLNLHSLRKLDQYLIPAFFENETLDMFLDNLKANGFRKVIKSCSSHQLCFKNKRFLLSQIGEESHLIESSTPSILQHHLSLYRDEIRLATWTLQEMLLRAIRNFPQCADRFVYSLRHTQEIIQILWNGGPFEPQVRNQTQPTVLDGSGMYEIQGLGIL